MSLLTILFIIVGGGMGLVVLAGLGVVVVKLIELVFTSTAYLIALACGVLVCWGIVSGFAKLM
jgi:hypothetical protein